MSTQLDPLVRVHCLRAKDIWVVYHVLYHGLFTSYYWNILLLHGYSLFLEMKPQIISRGDNIYYMI